MRVGSLCPRSLREFLGPGPKPKNPEGLLWCRVPVAGSCVGSLWPPWPTVSPGVRSGSPWGCWIHLSLRSLPRAPDKPPQCGAEQGRLRFTDLCVELCKTANKRENLAILVTGDTSLHLTWKHEKKKEEKPLLAQSPTVISRTISFPLQHPGYPRPGLRKVRGRRSLRAGWGRRGVASPLARSQVTAGCVMRARRMEGRRTREGQSHGFWKGLVFSRGLFSGICTVRLWGGLLGLSPAPASRTGRRELRFPPKPRAAWPPALRGPPPTGLSRLLRKGKARAPAPEG